jgi:hypothetical protein
MIKTVQTHAIDGSTTEVQLIPIETKYLNTQVTFNGRVDCSVTLTGVFAGGDEDYPELFDDTVQELDFSNSQFTFVAPTYSISHICVAVSAAGDNYTATVTQW